MTIQMWYILHEGWSKSVEANVVKQKTDGCPFRCGISYMRGGQKVLNLMLLNKRQTDVHSDVVYLT